MLTSEIIGGVLALIIGVILNYYSTQIQKPIDVIAKIIGIILIVIGIILIVAGFLSYGIFI